LLRRAERGFLLKFLAALLLLALAAAAGVGYFLQTPFGPAPDTPDAKATFVEIVPGTGTEGIAAQLEQAHVIRSRYLFDLLRLTKGGRLQAGEYRFNQPATPGEVYARIVRGDVFTLPLTIPEGYNIFDIATAVEAAGLGDRAAVLAAERSDTGLIERESPHAASLEGYLFPDTYRFPRTATPLQILTAMVRRFRQVAGTLDLGSDPARTARTVTLASLIEKEVSQDSERPLVAGVFINRLSQGMPLATDPSVIYAALLENRYRGTIYASDLESQSAYNTYRHTGLPPGPICNPGLAALKAAISPARTDYLYFVADAQGHSRFSATLKEHAEQVQAFRKATGEPIAPPKKPAPPSRKHRNP
jgi:UPF0755 protein